MNRDDRAVTEFGEEWQRFSQGELAEKERGTIFEGYSAIFPWLDLPAHPLGGVMRADAWDRFGTCLEYRFSRVQLSEMLETTRFGEPRFSDAQPFWCVLSTKTSV